MTDPQRIGQLPLEILADVTGATNIGQDNLEILADITGNEKIGQFGLEILADITIPQILGQFLLEILYLPLHPDEDYFWTKPIDNELKFGRLLWLDQDDTTRPPPCHCVATPGMSECMHGNLLTYEDCVSGAPPTYSNCMPSLQIPCED